ncbi:hypothetical protein VNI00_015374 [Paramarasmius palmivorus]|uniref:F-box domain-containing protein n=1 Tax=Paramarasmius palmivorus TaxID=297713 RepID=A0AAW0BNF0_9AGAR
MSTQNISELNRFLQDAEAEIRHYQTTIDMHKSTIVFLENKVSHLAQKIAKYRPLLSPIRRMPSDILREIFTLSNSGRIRPLCIPVPLSLSAVCGRWREVALQTPALWSSIDIFLQEEWEKNGQYNHLHRTVLTFLERSQNVPLDIILNFDGILPDSDATSILDALVAHSWRWQRLKLGNTLEECLRHQAFAPLESKGLPMLRTLALLDSREASIDDDTICNGYICRLFTCCPQLTSLRVKVDAPFTVQDSLPWQQIQKLEVRDSTCAAGLAVVAQCPNVDHLTVNRLTDSGRSDISHIAGPIKRLSIMGHAEEHVTSVMKNVSFDQLTSLEICGRPYRSSSTWDCAHDDTVNFLLRSSCRLTSLTLDGVPFSDKDTLSLLRLMPALTYLHIAERRCVASNQILTGIFLDQFRDTAATAPLLPNLTKVKLITHPQGLDVEALATALASRWISESGYASDRGLMCIEAIDVVFTLSGCHVEKLRAALGWMSRREIRLTVEALK